MKTYRELVEECLADGVRQYLPWDVVEMRERNPDMLILDVREPYEFDLMRIEGSLCVPRGVLESAAEFGYEETRPELAQAREREIMVVCRSGNRSVLAAHTLLRMGFGNAYSMQTGLRGWNDYEQPLVDAHGNPVSIEAADAYFAQGPRPEQMAP